MIGSENDMEKHRIAARVITAAFLLGLSVLLVLPFGSYREDLSSVEEEPNSPEETLVWEDGLRIAVASDLHYDPDNTDKSSSASAVQYNPELIEALLRDVRKQGSEMLLLTGDLVNGGKVHRHTMLADILRQAESGGMAIYVLPGNHDLSPIGQMEFADIYSEFGYGEAFSRDPASLSYSIVRDGLMLLMMDTGGYSVSAIDLPGAPKREQAGAFLSDETLQWAEGMLKEAENRQLRVLCAGHYNLLPETSRQEGGFYLENGSRFADLLRKYHAPLYLSGHMHIRSVYQEDGLTEMLTEYLLSYPTGYSMLGITDTKLQAFPRRVDVDAWAAETGQQDPVLLGYSSWQQEALQDYCRLVVEDIVQRNPVLTEEETDAASAFFYQAMDAFWRGTLHWERKRLESLPGYEPFFRCAEGFSYGWWIRDLLETASPLMAGFELPFSARQML